MTTKTFMRGRPARELLIVAVLALAAVGLVPNGAQSSAASVTTNGETGMHKQPHHDDRCSGAQRNGVLLHEQAAVLDLVGDLRTLKNESDLARLAVPNPLTGTAFNFYDHAFVSFRGMGLAIVNTGVAEAPGKPTLLLYAPDPDAQEVIDPYNPDFPYRLVGFGHASVYAPNETPTFLGPCFEKDWFVHERSVHRADTWQNIAVPPEEDFKGQVAGGVPPLPHECNPPCTGFAHGRLWDLHIWLADGNGVPTLSMTNPGDEIAGADPQIGRAFFFPERNKQHGQAR